MGTTLTGLTPATTYDALIKVGDNGPLSATAKYVGDGLGNDSVVALSTSSVGIGTTSPTQLLHVAGNVRITGALYDGNNAAGTSGQILSSTGTGTDWVSKSDLSLVDGSGTANYVSKWSDTDTLTNSVIYDNGTNVGVGTTSPNRLLTIKNSSDGVNGLSFQSYASTSELGYIRYEQTNDILDIVNTSGFASGGIKFSTSNTERLRITSAGNVGIGTSSPTEKLHIVSSSDVTVRLQRTGVRELNLSSAGITAGSEFLYLSSDYGALSNIVLTTNSAERMRITAAGNVGIGTSSPNVQLEVSAADNSLGGIFRLNNNRTSLFDGDQNGSIQFSNNEASGGANGVRSAILSLVRDTAGKTDLAFTTASSNGAASEKVRILADGGLTFNGDTAAANALDDYEEGTFTPTTSTSGYTIATSSGRYTKIGRQVTIQGVVNFSAVNASSNSVVVLLGNPFTPNSVYTGLCREDSNSGAAYVANTESGGSIIINSMDGVTTASQRTIRISENYVFTITYFV